MRSESELASTRQKMQEQEMETSDAIAKWQQSGTKLEEKCAELEERLKNAVHEKGSTEVMNSPELECLQLKEDNASLQEKIKCLENDVVQRQEALQVAQETLARDDEIVQQWEGKYRRASR